MIFKALRCRSGPDLYNLANPILKTLTTDKVTNRVRDIKPGEEVMSIFDDINHEGTKFFYGKMDPVDDTGMTVQRVFEEPNKFPRNLFYNDADALEDEILFPEEREAQRLDPKEIGKISPLAAWEEEGFSMRKFIEGWESDYSGEDSEDDKDDYEEGDSDDDEEMEDDDDADGQDVPRINPVDVIKKMGYSDELQQAMEKMMLMPRPKERNPSDRAVMEEDFMTLMDKEKARSKNPFGYHSNSC